MGLVGNEKSTSSNTSKEHLFSRFYKIIDTIKDRPDELSAIRKKHNLTESEVKEGFERVC